MDEIPIGQIIAAPNFNLGNPLLHDHQVAVLVLLLPLVLLEPQVAIDTLLPCPLAGGSTLMDGVHKGRLLDVPVGIGPTGGESLCWVGVNVVVHVAQGFTKGPGRVFGFKRAVTFALRRALVFASHMALTFALRRACALALQRALAFT